MLFEPVSRRTFLAGALAALGAARPATLASQRAAGRIHTVTGEIPADRLGLTLMHEHVLVDFIGAEQVSLSRYDRDEAFAAILPHLKQLRGLGCETLVECTPAYLGRDPILLKRLSEASGLQMLTNTGYYGAANDKHLPKHAFSETAEQLAARWIREHERGIDGSAIKPAFMKIGVDGAPLSEIDCKLVHAAALTHRATGLPIASHTGSGAAALEELDILDQQRVRPSAFIWVHAQSERDSGFHDRAAARGAWIEFDGISPTSVERHVELTVHMKTLGRLSQVLVSHDAGWYRVGEPGGGRFRPYDTLFTTFRPALTAAGFSVADVQQLLVVNPRNALQPGLPG